MSKRECVVTLIFAILFICTIFLFGCSTVQGLCSDLSSASRAIADTASH